MQRYLLPICVLALLAACNAVPVGPGPTVRERYSMTQVPGAARPDLLVVEITGGHVETEPVFPDWPIVAEAAVEVSGPTEEEARAFADRIRVTLEQEGNEARIRVLQPSLTPEGYEAGVTLHIAVPVRVALTIRTTSGDVLVQGPETDLTVTSITGNIVVKQGRPDRTVLRSTNGYVSAHIIDLSDTVDVLSVNGRAYGVVERGQSVLNVESENGDVGAAFSPEFQGRVDASTVNGVAAFSIDAPLTTDGKTVMGVLNAGNGLIRLRTTNGNVDLQGI